MSSGDWQQIEPVFLEASDLPPEERVAFLDRAFAAGSLAALPHLRREVEALLAAELANVSFLGGPPARLAADLMGGDGNQPSTRKTATIGPYRIRRVIGEGGMGTVYEAEQQTPRRTVALKVIRAGFSSEQVLRRFELEAEALGRLQHPGIAQIHDAGTADTGFGPQPYFAMEFISGVPLTEYAKAQDPPSQMPGVTAMIELSGAARPQSVPAVRHVKVRTRLELMAMVCDAVQHAHQRGIIHRDLKPGNILVDGTGQPKILDFGVARIVDAETQVTRQTDIGQLVGTVAYMSPEQALGNSLELDCRSDVYSLGLILYELLAGKLPHDTNLPMQEMLRAIREDDPAPLSSINGSYRGDIQNIVAKALEKDKSRRYQSAGELAEDLRRHLTDQPIFARTPSAFYKISKFTRRHRVLVGATASVMLVLSVGIVASTLQAVRAVRAERVALQQQQRALAAEKLARNGQEAAQRERRAAEEERNLALAAEAVARSEKIAALREKQRADAEAASALAVTSFLRNDMLAQADIYRQNPGAKGLDKDITVRSALDLAAGRIDTRFANQPQVEAAIRETIGSTYHSLGVGEQAILQTEKAASLYTASLGAENPKTLHARFLHAAFLYDVGKFADSERELTSVLAAQQKVLGKLHTETLMTLTNLGNNYLAQGKGAQAEKVREEALEGFLKTEGPDGLNTLSAMENLAISYVMRGSFQRAEALAVQVHGTRRRILGAEHPLVLQIMGTLAAIYGTEGKLHESEKMHEEALALSRKLRGVEHSFTLVLMNNLAECRYDLGRYSEAEPLFLETLELRRKTLGASHPSTLSTMGHLADNYLLSGQYAKAEKLYLETIELRTAKLGPSHPSTIMAVSGLAWVRRMMGNYASAEELYGKAIAAHRTSPGVEHPYTLNDMGGLAETYLAEGKYAEAATLFQQTLELRKKVLGPDNPATAGTMRGLAVTQRKQGSLATAETLVRSALKAEKNKLGPVHPEVAKTTVELSLLLLLQGKAAEAESFAKEAIHAGGQNPEEWHLSFARAVAGAALTLEGKFGEAEQELMAGWKALEAGKANLHGTDLEDVRLVRTWLARLYEAWGKPQLAAPWKN